MQGPADDGKRNEVQRNGDGRFVDVASRREGLKGRESEGGRVKYRSRRECGGFILTSLDRRFLMCLLRFSLKS